MIFKNKKDLVFIIALAIIHLLFYSFSVYQENFYPFSGYKFKISDSYQYLIEADNILKHGIFYSGDLSLPIDYKFYTLRPPGYPLFLAFFKFFDAPFYVILFFQNIISITSIYLVRKTLLLFNYNKKFDALFLFLIIITPSQLIYANSILTEVIFQLFLILMFRYAILYIKFKKTTYILWYSLALILAAYVKPAMYLFVIPSTLYMLYLSLITKKWYPILFSGLPILAVLLIFNWNYNRTKHIQYSSIQTINLLDYNTKFFLLSKVGELKSDKIIDSIHHNANQLKTFADKSKYLDKAAKNILTENLMPYIFYHLQGSVYAVLDPGRFDLAYFFKFKTSNAKNKGILYHINNGGVIGVLKFLTESYSATLLLILAIIIFFNIIKIIMFLVFLLNKNISINLRIITGGLFFYIVLLVGPVGASRYLMPLVPIIIGAGLLNTALIETVSKKLLLINSKRKNVK